MNKEFFKPMKRLVATPGFKSFGASLSSIFIGLFIGFLIMLFSAITLDGANPILGLGYLLAGPFTALDTLNDFGNMVFYTVPLIFTSLSVALAYKTGLFNIGAPGQFLMGTMCALLIALNINSVGNSAQGFFVWMLAVLVAGVAGLLWGLIPGALKAFFGINEVIISIMSNWIAANIFTWVFSSDSLAHLINKGFGKSGYLITTTVTGNGTPDFGLGALTHNSYLDIGIFIAIIVGVLCWLLLNKTTIGFSMKACGQNNYAARYAGINDKFNIVLAMGIAGALAGIGGAMYYLHPGIEIQFKSVYQSLPDYGFSGIAGAFLANCNPIGAILSAFFIRYINASGNNLVSAGYNKYFADIIIAIIIYLAGFTTFFQNVISKGIHFPWKKKKVVAVASIKNNQEPIDSDVDKKKEDNK